MSNIQTIQELYVAFDADGLERVFELCDPECVVTQDDALPWGGRYEGLDGAASFGLALGATTDSTITTEALFEAGDRVVQTGRSRGHVVATGVEFDVPEVHVWTLRGGKVAAAEFYIDTPAMLRVLDGAS